MMFAMRRFPSARLLNLSTVVFLLLFTVPLSCGIKSLPDRPEASKPPAVGDVQVRGAGGKLVFHWATPKSLSAELSVSGFSVYRKTRRVGDSNPASVKTHLMGEIKAPAGGPGHAVSFTDSTIKPGESYEYHIFSFNAAKKLGPDKVVGPFAPVFPSKQVGGFSLQAVDGAALLSWLPFTQAPATAASPGSVAAPGLMVNIYRAEGEEGPYGSEPINAEPISGGQYRDGKVMPGLIARYKVRAVRVDGDVQLEGPFSEEKKVEVVDNTPPPAPMVLWIKPLADGVRLRWQAVNDAGLLGYYVERRPKAGESADFKDVSNFLTVDEFTDRQIPEKGDYVYRVVARDRAGNRSFSGDHIVSYTAKKPDEPKPATEATKVGGESGQGAVQPPEQTTGQSAVAPKAQ